MAGDRVVFILDADNKLSPKLKELIGNFSELQINMSESGKEGTAAFKDLISTLEKTASEGENAGNTIWESMGNAFQKVREVAAMVFKAFVAGFAAVAASIGVVTGMASSLDSELRSIVGMWSQEEANIEGLRTAFIQLSAELGDPAVKLAQTFKEIKKLGGKESGFADLAEQAHSLGDVIGGDLTTNAKTIQILMNTMGDRFKTAGDAAAFLYQGARLAGLSIETMSSEILKSVLSMQQLGLSMEDTMGILGTLTRDMGEGAGLAAFTNLTMSVRQLMSELKETDQSIKPLLLRIREIGKEHGPKRAFQEMRASLYDFGEKRGEVRKFLNEIEELSKTRPGEAAAEFTQRVNDMIAGCKDGASGVSALKQEIMGIAQTKGVMAAFDTLAEKLKGVNAEQRGIILNEIFSRSAGAVGILLDQMEQVKQMSASFAKGPGSDWQKATIIADKALREQLEMLKESIKGVALQIGAVFLPAVTSITSLLRQLWQVVAQIDLKNLWAQWKTGMSDINMQPLLDAMTLIKEQVFSLSQANGTPSLMGDMIWTLVDMIAAAAKIIWIPIWTEAQIIIQKIKLASEVAIWDTIGTMAKALFDSPLAKVLGLAVGAPQALQNIAEQNRQALYNQSQFAAVGEAQMRAGGTAQSDAAKAALREGFNTDLPRVMGELTDFVGQLRTYLSSFVAVSRQAPVTAETTAAGATGGEPAIAAGAAAAAAEDVRKGVITYGGQTYALVEEMAGTQKKTAQVLARQSEDHKKLRKEVKDAREELERLAATMGKTQFGYSS